MINIYEGASVEEAVEHALATLGLARDQVAVEVLEMPVKKMFGTSPAKVKVTPNDGAVAAAKPAAVDTQVQKVEANSFKNDYKNDRQPRQNDGPRQSDRPRQNEGPRQNDGPRREARPIAPVEETVLSEAQLNTSELAAKAFLAEVVGHMHIAADIEVAKRGDSTVFKISGEEAHALIGRRGETMEALSYITSLVANKGETDFERVSIDVGNYRAKRDADLASLARRTGIQVAKTGRSHTFEPMNPYERRIIHATISEMYGLKSESTGEGADRRIVISPSAGAQAGAQSADRNDKRGRGGSKFGRGPRNNKNVNRGERPAAAVQTAAPQADEKVYEALDGVDTKALEAKFIEKLGGQGDAPLYSKIK